MKKLMMILGIALFLSTMATATEIAISTQANWWSQDAADREMQEIVDNVTGTTVELFTATDEDALADWVAAHTGNGVNDLVILCGKCPASIYAGSNGEPDGSLVELFIDDGNTVINTGDWIFYVATSGGNSGETALPNIMDISSMSMWDAADLILTEDAATYTPTLEAYTSPRPWHLDQLSGDWYPELILGQNEAGTLAAPIIVRNAYSGGRIGTFYQISGQDDLPRGEVISEWINNWLLTDASVQPNARGNVPAPGAVVDETTVVLQWKAGDITQLNAVYFSETLEEVSEGLVEPVTTPETSVSTADIAAYADGLTPGATYYWRVDQIGTDGQIYEGDVWSFMVRPLIPWSPTPADGAINVIPGATLTWEPSTGAMVYFLNISETLADVNDAAAGSGTPILGGTEYISAVEEGKTYYWRVDAMDDTTTYAGDVWSFSTVPAVEISDPNLVGWWTLDEGAGTTAIDQSGYGGHGSLVGSPEWTTGFIGGALEFEVGDYVDCGYDSGDSITNDFTLAVWAKNAPASDGHYGGLAGKLSRMEGGEYMGFSLVRHSSNVFRLWVGDGDAGGITGSASSDATYTDTEWHHVAGVRTGNLNTLYVDGVLQTATTENVLLPSTDWVHIGRQYAHLDDRYYLGTVDDVRIYDKALTAEELGEVIVGDAVFMERFDAYDPNSEIHGQGGWKGWYNTASATGLATDANDPVGPGAVEIMGSSDLVHEFDVDGGAIEFSAMQYIPSGTTGTTYFILLSAYNDEGVDMEWTVQTTFNLETGAITAYGGTTDVTTIVYDQWVPIKCVIDLDNNTIDEYYNGVLLESREWSASAKTTLQAIDLYGAEASSVYYDDIVIR